MAPDSKHNETIVLHAGFRSDSATNAVAVPIYQTSSYQFDSTEHAANLFGLKDFGNIYTRIMNPTCDVLEKRLAALEGGVAALAVSSGQSASMMAVQNVARAGDNIVSSTDLYGGTWNLFANQLKQMGIECRFVDPTDPENFRKATDDKTRAYYAETLPNPKLHVFPIKEVSDIGREFGIPLIMDNTAAHGLCKPFEHGAAIIASSCTKYIGGHSDLIAGAVLGNAEILNRVKVLRTFLGNMISPHTAWLLLRSLETLKVRMEQQAANAQKIASFLTNHPKIEKVHYLGNLEENSHQYELYKKQYSSPGAMVSFDIIGGEKEAFQFLNNLNLIKLAVSLGSTESLAQHPASMTHIGVDSEVKEKLGITEKLVRLSIGVEFADDLIWDIKNALSTVKKEPIKEKKLIEVAN